MIGTMQPLKWCSRPVFISTTGVYHISKEKKQVVKQYIPYHHIFFLLSNLFILKAENNFHILHHKNTSFDSISSLNAKVSWFNMSFGIWQI